MITIEVVGSLDYGVVMGSQLDVGDTICFLCDDDNKVYCYTKLSDGSISTHVYPASMAFDAIIDNLAID